MRTLYQKLLILIASATQKQLAGQMSYLLEENKIYRANLPGRIRLTDKQRNRLARFGASLAGTLDEFCSIVHPNTLRRWIREWRKLKPRPHAPRGRPRTPDDITALILRLARENQWGYIRILAELKKLGIESVSRTTIKNILKEHGLDPAPERHGTWRQFIRQHFSTLWQCDFFSKKVITSTGFRDIFVLAFLHVESRRVFLTPATYHPDDAWIQTQAAAFLNHVEVTGLQAEYLIHDRDTKFTAAFDQVLEAAGTEVQRTAILAPNMNAYIERFVGSIKSEVLDHFVVFGETHMNHLCAEYLAFYNAERPHQSIGNVPLTAPDEPVMINDGERATISLDSIRCSARLGGLLNHYHRKVA